MTQIAQKIVCVSVRPKSGYIFRKPVKNKLAFVVATISIIDWFGVQRQLNMLKSPKLYGVGKLFVDAGCQTRRLSI